MEHAAWRRGCWLAAVPVAVALGAILTLDPLAGLWVRFALILAAITALVVGARRHRPSRPRPWWTLTAGLSASALGDVIVLASAVGGRIEGNVPADAWLTALAGVLLLVAMVDVSRTTLSAPATGALDAVIVTVASGTALWQLLVVQAATPGWTGSGTELAGAVQVTALLGVAALLGRVVGVLPADQRTAARLLLAGVVAGLVAFLFGAFREATGGALVYGGARGVFGAVANLAAGAAALHPSMRALTSPRELRVEPRSRARTAALGVALATPFGVLLVATSTDVVVAPVSLAVAGLVLVATVMVRIERVQRVRERTQRDLHRTEARLISLVAHTGDTVLLVAAPVTGPARIRFASPSARRLLGRPPQELRDVDPLEVVAPADRDRMADLLHGAQPLPRTGDVRAAHRDGTTRWVEAVVAAAPGEEERSVVVTLRDVDVRKRQELALLEAATRDELTGLWNRRAFLLALDASLGTDEGQVARAAVDGAADRPASVDAGGPADGDGPADAGDEGRVAVLLIDLDGFKDVNDAAGHAVGDAVLQRLARRLERAVREGDLVARIGGDEFAVLCRGLEGPEPLTAVAERIVAVGAEPVEVDDRSVGVGLSVGIAVARPDERSAVLLARADAAMYGAKHDGKGRYRVAQHVPGGSASR